MSYVNAAVLKTKKYLYDLLNFGPSIIERWARAFKDNKLHVFTAAFAFAATAIASVLSLVGIVLLGISFPFQIIHAYISDKTQQPKEEKEEELPIDNTWKQILEYGRWAPSPHNMQPWVFKMEEDNTVTLMYDPTRLLPGTNPIGSFVHVGFGILTETLSIAAAQFGLDVKVSQITSTLDSNLVGPQALAKLELVQREKAETLNPKLIIERQTSRLPYNGKKIDKNILDELSAIAAEYGHKLEFSEDDNEVKWAIELNAKTMFYDMSIEKARNEVSFWMRSTSADAEKRADGLAAYAMNTPGYLMWMFAHFNWIFNLPGIHQKVLNQYQEGMSGTPAVAWLTGPFKTFGDWDKAGHMMARLWLTMTKHGVYLHPFGSVITNQKAHTEMVEHFKIEENKETGNEAWMLVRMGHGDKPPQAQRMPLSKMILNGGGFFKKPQTEESHDINDLQLANTHGK